MTQLDGTRLPEPADDAMVEQVFHPAFPPDQDAGNVIASLRFHAEWRASTLC